MWQCSVVCYIIYHFGEMQTKMIKDIKLNRKTALEYDQIKGMKEVMIEKGKIVGNETLLSSGTLTEDSNNIEF